MKLLGVIVDGKDIVNKEYVDNAVAGKADLVTTIAQTAGQATNAEIIDGDAKLKFDRSGDIMDLHITNGELSNTVFLSTKSYVDNAVGTVDQTYDETSTNAQSGTAVAEAIETVKITAITNAEIDEIIPPVQ